MRTRSSSGGKSSGGIHSPSADEMLFQLSVRTATRDRLPPPTPVLKVYLFTETDDNMASSILALRSVVSKYEFGPLDVCLLDDRNATNRGYSGVEKWEKACKSHLSGVGGHEPRFCRVAHDSPLNTLSEACTFAMFAEKLWRPKRSMGDLIIIAPPFHILRAFMSMLTATSHLCTFKPRIYCFPGDAMGWTRKVKHSQGTLEASWHDLLVEEIRRIRHYQKEGSSAPFPLVSDEAALDYFKWLDSH